jgi:hypothetical protein
VTPHFTLLAVASPVPTIDSVNFYVLAAIVLVLAAIALVAIPLLLRNREPHARATSRHGVNRNPEKWRDDVAAVLDRYHAGELSENEAYSSLARIARAFASLRLGTDLTTKTLLDLKRHHQIGSRAHFDALKQTISALYPPEFADAASNTQAAESSVESAANWVDSMIERWVA